jgi:putative transcriptional regulator
MSDGNTTRVKSNPRKPLSGKSDWRRIDAMSDAAVMRAAIADSDARPTHPRDLKRFRRVVRVRDLRYRLRMTQEQFARAFGFSVGALRDWEQMRSRPDAGTRALLQVIDFDPDTVRRALEPRRRRGRLS